MGIMGGPGIGRSHYGFMLDCILTLASQQTTTTGPGVGGHHRKLVVLELLQDIISFKYLFPQCGLLPPLFLHVFISGLCFCVCNNAENGAIYFDTLQVKQN
jgi:hypothetical protein